MAKKASAENVSAPSARLTKEQKEEIVQALDSGQTGAEVAHAFGKSVATIYAIRKRTMTPAKSSGQTAESPLRQALVVWSIKTLMGEEVSPQETDDLKAKLRAQMIGLLSAGV